MCLKERSKNYEWKEKRKIEQNKQNKNVLSKGVEEKNKHEILQGKTKANKPKDQEKEKNSKKGLFGEKKTENISNCRSRFFVAQIVTPLFDIHSNSALFGRGGACVGM